MSATPTARPTPGPAPANETPAQRAARQLRDLLKRKAVDNPAELERMMKKAGVKPVSQVTVRRILKAEAATEPEKDTLRRLAEFLHETYEGAFPEPSFDHAPTIEFRGQRLVITSPDNQPLSPSLIASLQRILSESPHPKK